MSEQLQAEKEQTSVKEETKAEPREKKTTQDALKEEPEKSNHRRKWGYCDDTSGGPHSLLGF